MKSKVIWAALALAFALCLTACGCRHEWREAHCDSPKTCIVCGLTEGEKLPHQPGQWMLAHADYVQAQNHLLRKCKSCDAVLEEYTATIDKFYNGTTFLTSAQDFTERLVTILEQLQERGGKYSAEITDADGKAQLNIGFTEFGLQETVGELTFAVGGDELDYDRKDEEGEYLAVGGILDADHLAVLMPSLILTVDPAMDVHEAFTLAAEWVSDRSVVCNGLQYDIVSGTEAAVWFMIRIEP